VLQVIERESNTLCAIIRQGYDTGDLRILTKRQAARATGAHICIIGHITKDELKRLLTDTAVGGTALRTGFSGYAHDAQNFFQKAPRFIWSILS
jgi:hypothetical protein